MFNLSFQAQHHLYLTSCIVGILDDLRTIGKPNVGLQFLDEDLTPLFLMDLSMRPH